MTTESTYTLTKSTQSKSGEFTYTVTKDDTGELISTRKSKREYVACTINGSYYFGRLDLIGKGDHGRYLKNVRERNLVASPIAYLKASTEEPTTQPETKNEATTAELTEALHDLCKLLRIYSRITEPSLRPDSTSVDAGIYRNAVVALKKAGIDFDMNQGVEERRVCIKVWRKDAERGVAVGGFFARQEMTTTEMNKRNEELTNTSSELRWMLEPNL